MASGIGASVICGAAAVLAPFPSRHRTLSHLVAYVAHAFEDGTGDSWEGAAVVVVGLNAHVSGVPVVYTVDVSETVYSFTTVDVRLSESHAQSGRREASGHTKSGVGPTRGRVKVTVFVVGQAGLSPGTVAVTVPTVTVVTRGMVTGGTVSASRAASCRSQTIPHAGPGIGWIGMGGHVFAGGLMMVCV